MQACHSLGELRKGRIIHAHGPSPSCSINNRLHYSAKGIFRHIWRPKLVGWLYLDREYLGVFSFVDRKPFVENQRCQADRWAFSCLWNFSASEGFAPHQEPRGFGHMIFLSSRLFCGFVPPQLWKLIPIRPPYMYNSCTFLTFICGNEKVLIWIEFLGGLIEEGDDSLKIFKQLLLFWF